ncbi:MAG: hypothetical protein FK733_01915 [Asgard group archaeon]|nr:hypothetical protein [Asgard group archaeon]
MVLYHNYFEVIYLSDKEKVSDAYKKFAEDLNEIEEKDKEKRKKVLKDGILDLEQKYKEEIKGTHAVDARLVKLRKEAGMPELIGVGDKVEKKRFKDKEKYEQFLAKEVLEVGIEESRNFGGIMKFKQFCVVFENKRPNWIAPEKEIRHALETLAINGLIPKLYRMKDKSILITFRPAELESDIIAILNIASVGAKLTKADTISILGWQKERIDLALKSLIDQKMALFDKKEQIYFFPALQK